MKVSLLRSVLAPLLLSGLAGAQCAFSWAAETGVPTPPAFSVVTARSALWDPDSSGPLGQRILFGYQAAVSPFSGTQAVGAYDLATDTWQQFGSHSARACAVSAGQPILAGSFNLPGGPYMVVRWDGASLQPVGASNGLWAVSLAVLPNGDIVVGGSMTSIGGVAVNGIARWNGSNWQPMGAGWSNANVNHLFLRRNGELVAGGTYQPPGGAQTSILATWTGSSWVNMGPPPSSAGGGTPSDFAELPNGDLIACGSMFINSLGTYLVRWSGAAWQPFSASFGPNDSPFAMLVLPDGDLLLSGSFTTSGVTSKLIRWDGFVKHPFPVDASGSARTLLMDAIGQVYLTGAAVGQQGLPSNMIARMASSCPASAVPVGSGCVGSGGANLLAATNLPWLGTTFRSQATGLPAVCIAVDVVGFAPQNLPLDAVFAEGVPGCALLATPDLLAVALPVGGVLDTALALPANPAIVGVTIREQVVAMELGVGGLVAVTATNALGVTVGDI